MQYLAVLLCTDCLIMLSQSGAKLAVAQLRFGFIFVVASLWVYVENARAMVFDKLLLSGFICIMIYILFKNIYVIQYKYMLLLL
jgi:hypothetical protein